MPRKKLYNDDDTIPFSIRLPTSLRELLEKRANENRRSLNQEIVWLIQYALTHLGDRAQDEAKR